MRVPSVVPGSASTPSRRSPAPRARLGTLEKRDPRMSDLTVAAETGPALVTCALCSASVRSEDTKLANGHRVCPACALQLQAELARANEPDEVLPRAIALGALGGLLGAAVWAIVLIVTDFE